MWTNRGKYNNLLKNYRSGDSFFFALLTAATVPTAAINTLGELTQIAAGNGYAAGGIALTGNATDFDVLTEDDTNNRALVQLRDLVFTPTGGPLPASGAGVSYAALTGPNATVGSREVNQTWDLPGGPHSVSAGQAMTIQDAEIRLT